MVAGAEEVTKHSVHTLVFRSQKRSHEMFISDQGNLPESDKQMDLLIKKIKAKAYYGQNLVTYVDKEKAKKLNYDPTAVVPATSENPDTSITSTNAGNVLLICFYLRYPLANMIRSRTRYSSKSGFAV